MNKLCRSFIFLFLILFVSCSHKPEQDAEEAAKKFIESVYSLDYEGAKALCTYRTFNMINLLAANITQEYIDLIKKHGKVKVVILHTTLNEDGTSAIIVYRISNFLQINFLKETASIVNEAEKEIRVIRIQNKWLADIKP